MAVQEHWNETAQRRVRVQAVESHAFVGFLKDEKWHVGPGFTPVSCKNSRGNGPHSCLRWPRLGFSSHFLQPIYLSLQKTSASPLGLSIYLSKYRAPLKFQLYLRGKNAIQFLEKAALLPSSERWCIQEQRRAPPLVGKSVITRSTKVLPDLDEGT